MKQYQDLLRHIMDSGVDRSDRTGTGTRSVFGYQMRFNLEEGFPLLTTKKMALRAIIYELLWFLKGDNNLKYLAENNVNIWNEWPFKAYLKTTNRPMPEVNSELWKTEMSAFVDKVKTDNVFAVTFGNLGPIYGYQWRSWPTPDGKTVDQLSQVLNQIKNNPDSRRIIVSAWNVSDIDEMAKAGLPPCHCLFQFYVANGRLSCQLYQRSADVFLGVPFNIASYSLLTMMMAQVTGLRPGDFVHTLGDTHIYSNHFDQVKEQLSREPKHSPTMKLNPDVKDLFDFKFEDFSLENYEFHPAIKAQIAV